MMIQQAVFVVCRGTNNYFVTVFIEKHVIFIATGSKIRNVLLLQGGYAGKRGSRKKNDREDREDLKMSHKLLQFYGNFSVYCRTYLRP